MLFHMCIFMFRLMMIDVHSHKPVSNTHETGIPKKNNTRSLFFSTRLQGLMFFSARNLTSFSRGKPIGRSCDHFQSFRPLQKLCNQHQNQKLLVRNP